MSPIAPPRIEKLRIRNYRTLRDVTIDLEPFTVFVGANGSGKSTILDVFSFLSECFSKSLPEACERRGHFHELRSRGAAEDESISFEFKYRESEPPKGKNRPPLITYHLEISEKDEQPVVSHEFLSWKRHSWGAPFKFLEFRNGIGAATNGEDPDEKAERKPGKLTSRDTLAVNAYGQFQEHPRVESLREFITGWKLFYLSSEHQRGQPESGPQKHLSENGGNLANVVQFLQERHPEILQRIFNKLQRRIPGLERVEAGVTEYGYLLLRFKDRAFKEPVPARFVSDGTLKLLSYMILLHDPDAPPLIGIEEPENFLHPKLLYGLADECQAPYGCSQFLTTTHSPEFLNGVEPQSARFLQRDDKGYTQIRDDAEYIEELDYHITKPGKLGHFWMEGYIRHGDPES